MGLQGVTRGGRGIEVVTGGYWWLKEVTGVHKG